MKRFLLLAALSLGMVANTGLAQSLPPVNLGLTSFLDGGPPAGPGFYYQQYLQYYHGESLKDANGDSLPVPVQPQIDVYASLNQFIYQSNQPILFGGKWGVDFIVPIVGTNLDPGSTPLTDNGFGLGDVLLGPFIQWDPIMCHDRPVFLQRVELQTVFPSGKYDNDRNINPGSNFYSFDPYWAATVLPTPKCELSWRLHYLWNSENNDPNINQFPGASDTRAGQAVHINFASSYALIPNHLRAGVNGYYLKQTTDSQVDGVSNPNTQAQVLGIGPGLLYSFSPDNHIFANVYFETLAENTFEGIRVVLRWTHHF